MIKITTQPEKKDWVNLVKRPMQSASELFPIVKEVLEAVREVGDNALRSLTKKFDGVELKEIACDISSMDIEKDLQIDPKLLEAMKVAASNIEAFHRAQMQEPLELETMLGVVCKRKSVPIQKVGLYIPGGTAPLFSTVLMLAIPAKIAGCQEIVLCTPPNKKGEIPSAILAAAKMANIKTVYKIGGAQAIAAMAYGTETVPKTHKIFGPGNQYVTAAKQLVSLDNVAIDMPAGPSEIAVYANETSYPSFVASDLLSQAEHGIDSQVVLVSSSEKIAVAVNEALTLQLASLSRKDIARKSLDNSVSVILKDEAEAIDFLNDYAAEHLILAIDTAEEMAKKIINAGSIFLGHFTPESAGDYASGTNHTLPTNGTSTAYSGVSIDSFVKKITLQNISETGIKTLGPHIEVMAAAELLDAHKNAVTVRLKNVT